MNDTMQRHGSVLLPPELLPSSLSFVGRYDKSSQVFKKTTLPTIEMTCQRLLTDDTTTTEPITTSTVASSTSTEPASTTTPAATTSTLQQTSTTPVVTSTTAAVTSTTPGLFASHQANRVESCNVCCYLQNSCRVHFRLSDVSTSRRKCSRKLRFPR
jgi:hypothetical protein